VQPSNPREEDGCWRTREEDVELRERPPGGHLWRTRPPRHHQWPPSNPCMRGPRERVPHEKGAPVGLLWWQQSGSLLVFADGLLKPFFIGRKSTNVCRGVVAFVVVEQPLGGAWRRLRPFELQPPGRIGEGGRGQMSRRGSTVPHLGRIREGIIASPPLPMVNYFFLLRCRAEGEAA